MAEKDKTTKKKKKKVIKKKKSDEDYVEPYKGKILTPAIIHDNFTDYDKRFIALQKKHPDWKPHKVAREIENRKIPRHLYTRLNQNEYLSLAIEQIRSSHAEQLSRVITPKALQELEDALDDKSLARKEKFSYVKLALDKEPKFADRKDAIAPPRINIEQIQILIKQGLGSEDYLTDDVIDGEVIEEGNENS